MLGVGHVQISVISKVNVLNLGATALRPSEMQRCCGKHIGWDPKGDDD